MVRRTKKEETPMSVILGDTIDLTEYTGKSMWDEDSEPRTFELIPNGRYNARVRSIEGPNLNNAGDGYQLKVNYELMDEGVRNRRLSQWISLKPTALWKLREFMTAMGRDQGDDSYTPGEFDGNYVTINVTTRPATDRFKESNEVRNVYPLDDNADASDWL